MLTKSARSVRRAVLSCVAIACAASVPSASAYDFRDYYVAIDGRPDQTGVLINHPNPNFGRLTLILAHDYPNPWSGLSFNSNHYHRIGAWAHVVPPGTTTPLPASPAPATFFTNVRAPEGTHPAMKLRLGVQPGRYVLVDTPDTVSDQSTDYDNLTFAPVHEMASAAGSNPGSQALATNPAQAMYFSSRFTSGSFVNQPRYTGSLGNAIVGLQLVTKTAGLNIENALGAAIFMNPGDSVTLGQGDSWAAFEPKFWVSDSVADATNFSATFRLIDLNTASGHTPLQSSGEFRFDMITLVPEPTTLAASAMLGVAALVRRRK